MESTINKEKKKDLFSIDPRLIIANEADNPRSSYDNEHIEYLKNSILENGMVNPMKGMRGTGEQKGKYILLQGFHRYKSVTKLIEEGINVKLVPMMLRNSKGYTIEQRLLDTLTDNGGLALTKIDERLKKEDIPDMIEKTLKIKFPYVINAKGKIAEESFDMADAIAAALSFTNPKFKSVEI